MAVSIVKSFVVVVSVFSVSLGAKFNECENGPAIKNDDDLKVSDCLKQPCKLRINHTITVEYKFHADARITTLVNDVTATIGPLVLPYPGIDGTNACHNIYMAGNEKKKTRCPLEQGKDYIYKNNFFIYNFYPRTRLVVHWALRSGKKNIICFETAAKIL